VKSKRTKQADGRKQRTEKGIEGREKTSESMQYAAFSRQKTVGCEK